MTLEVLAGLFAVAVAAGCLDAIAGGGGLMTVPTLLIAGLDPVSAIATNKLQGSFSTASSTWAFARARLIDRRRFGPLAGIAFAASIGGALCAKLLPRDLLSGLIPVLLIGIALYFALSRKMRDEDSRARISLALFAGTVTVVVGFYDGLFGPGAGSFYMVGLVSLLGLGVVKATAHTKLLNFSSNAGSLCFFIAAGAVVWPAGLVMAVGAVIGAQVGSRLAMRWGARLIRPLVVVISLILAARLLLDPDNPLRAVLARFL